MKTSQSVRYCEVCDDIIIYIDRHWKCIRCGAIQSEPKSHAQKIIDTYEVEYERNIADLYKAYCDHYAGNPKHDFSHFVRVISQWKHHRTLIRPMIAWWSQTSTNNG